MPQSLAKNLIHLIYSTKDHEPCLAPEIRDELFRYKAGILKEWKSPALAMGGDADHVHVLFCLEWNTTSGSSGGEHPVGPFQGKSLSVSQYPGRCPGLICYCPVGTNMTEVATAVQGTYE